MQCLCDACHGVYKNKQSFYAHQNRTGHRQNAEANFEDSVNLKTEIASLQDSVIAKDNEIASLQDSIIANNAEITRFQDSLKTYETNIANLLDEVAQLSSLEKAYYM